MVSRAPPSRVSKIPRQTRVIFGETYAAHMNIAGDIAIGVKRTVRVVKKFMSSLKTLP